MYNHRKGPYQGLFLTSAFTFKTLLVEALYVIIQRQTSRRFVPSSNRNGRSYGHDWDTEAGELQHELQHELLTGQSFHNTEHEDTDTREGGKFNIFLLPLTLPPGDNVTM